ncbi:lipocalin family protein [Paraburkholderia bannensis]|uniref:lipocalin family protein n=1 Tax=Paraburkholderia bannensis TaxID=765414 RepID=UPI002AB058FE|nr:lipocalin family protein [Paraburkholderia bannensis]
MQKKPLVIALTGVTMLLAACAYIPRPGPVGNHDVPQPAKPVELARYMGRWYEQFRYEASFERNMDEVTADYSLNADGTVKVINSGRRTSDANGFKQSVGNAKVADPTNAKLKVSFFGPFYGDYWILDHDDDYSWSIVGEPSGRYLWVLTRDAYPPGEILNNLQARVKTLGYDWSLVRRTKQ